ncbi:DUF4145 domain-containing protein [Bradyrhizobium sp. USDA 313]|uniref:DUF4145 domain-containing protein n=1 Tax=Bradyrhizobium sp. USDA 313 TaxID=3156307 RepID=UPI00351184FE
MTAVLDGENVRARCPNCDGAVTTFEARKIAQGHDAALYLQRRVQVGGKWYQQTIYRGLRCAGCGRGGMVVYGQNGNHEVALVDFYPRTLNTASIPQGVPADLKAEFREAEIVASVGAWRAASAMLRSTLEKTLKHNGYAKGSLAAKIDEAAADGVITAARSKRAHEDIRVLGNDVLHDAWREVTEDEYDLAHRYSQRILEDLYDDRQSVESLLRSVGRLPTSPSGEGTS